MTEAQRLQRLHDAFNPQELALLRATGDDCCHAQRDGDCIWGQCPQIRDGEPERSGRHCPLDWRDPNDDFFGA
jgi:hypothetical protein